MTFACTTVAGGRSSELPPRASPFPVLPSRSSCPAPSSRERSDAGLQALGSPPASRVSPDDSGEPSALVGFRICRPSAVQRCCVHSPTPEGVVRRAGTTQCVPFRPHGFSPSRRLAPLHRLRVCFAPLPAMGFTTFPASPRARHRSDEARLTFPIVHEPFEVCPRLQPYRVTTAPSTLTLRPVMPDIGPAPIPSTPLPAQGSSNPPRWASTSPPRHGTRRQPTSRLRYRSAIATPDPKIGRTLSRGLSARASTPSANEGGLSATETERSPPWRFSADESMMPHPYGSDIRSFHGFWSPPRCCHPLAAPDLAVDFPTWPIATLGELWAEAHNSEASHRPSVDRPAQSPLRFGASLRRFRRPDSRARGPRRRLPRASLTSASAPRVPCGKPIATHGCGGC